MTSGTGTTVRAGCTALGIVLLSAVTAACASSSDTRTASATTPPAATAPSAATPQPTEASQPAATAQPDQVATATPVPDRLAPSSYRPVIRHGRTPRPTVTPTTGNAGEQRTVAYGDGVSVQVTKVSQSVEQGHGPGVFPGRPHTALTLTLVNRSARTLDLTQVVVTALYGSPTRVATPVYEDPAARDFAGTLKPGGSATAVYVFSIPTTATSSVTAIVDFDDVHVAARVRAGK